MVASRRRGESVLGYLADRGVPQHLLDRVRVPIGLDLGHTSHTEIAVAILAELVQLRASGALAPDHASAVGRARDRDRPGVRHDGHDLALGALARARRRHLLLLRRGLPHGVRQGGAVLITNDVRRRPARRQGLAVLRRHPAGGRMPPRCGAHRRPGRRQLQGQGRDSHGAGQAPVRGHRRRSRSATTRTSGSWSTLPVPTRRAAVRPPCWSRRIWCPRRVARRSRSTQDLQLQGAAAQYGRGMISDVSTVLMRDFAANMQNRIAAIERGDVTAQAASAAPAGGVGIGVRALLMALSRLSRRLFLPYRPAAS